MQLYVNAKIIACSKESFENKQGDPVEFYKIYLKDSEGGVGEVTSGKDYTRFEGQEGVAVVVPRERTGGGFKLSLIDFRPEATIAF